MRIVSDVCSRLSTATENLDRVGQVINSQVENSVMRLPWHELWPHGVKPSAVSMKAILR